MKKAALLVGIGLLVGAAVGALSARSARPWLPFLAQWLDVGEALCQADVVLSLPGDDERRPYVAAALVKTRLARKAIIVECATGPDEWDGVRVPSHVITRTIYRARGLRPDQIVLLRGTSSSTADDLAILQEYLLAHPQDTACVVTNAFHTRRTRWTLRNRLPDEQHRLTVISAPNVDFTEDDWWKTSRGLEDVLSEYFKLGWYWLRYGHGMYWITGAAAICIALAAFRIRRARRASHLPVHLRFGE